jgi:hypothetical protein
MILTTITNKFGKSLDAFLGHCESTFLNSRPTIIASDGNEYACTKDEMGNDALISTNGNIAWTNIGPISDITSGNYDRTI